MNIPEKITLSAVLLAELGKIVSIRGQIFLTSVVGRRRALHRSV